MLSSLSNQNPWNLAKHSYETMATVLGVVMHVNLPSERVGWETEQMKELGTKNRYI